jgi:hypothetical protein
VIGQLTHYSPALAQYSPGAHPHSPGLTHYSPTSAFTHLYSPFYYLPSTLSLLLSPFYSPTSTLPTHLYSYLLPLSPQYSLQRLLLSDQSRSTFTFVRQDETCDTMEHPLYHILWYSQCSQEPHSPYRHLGVPGGA